MDILLSKLDLADYASSFAVFLAREKPLFMEGDIHLHYELILELENVVSLAEVPPVVPLDRALSLLQKNGVLRIEEIFAFVRIINYFVYLKTILLENKLGSWMQKIIIPDTFLDICDYFDTKGAFKPNIDKQFASIQKSLQIIKEEMQTTLKRSMSGEKISAYLVDRQVYFINNQEALLVRGGFNHVLKGNIIGRSSAGFFYVTPESIAKLKTKQSDLLSSLEALIYKYCKEISGVFAKNFLFLKFINKEFDRFDAYAARVVFAKQKNMSFVLPHKGHAIRLSKFCHPALGDPKPISIDFSRQVLMITGVNAGGKTMLLKSIISAAFLAKYLLPMKIDAHNSQIGSFKELYAILDDPQNVKNDISTFAGRMSQFAQLLRKKSTLAGIDEIELGTDADEAASLFKILIEQLIDKEMKIVITTHHKRLASLLATHPQVELLAAIYDAKNQRPTYGFLQGTIGKSYAFETALRYGIPAALIAKAREVYGEDKEKLNDLIQKNIDLELSMRSGANELEEKLADMQRRTNQLIDLKEQYQEEFASLRQQLSKEYKEAIFEAKEAIRAKDVAQAHRHLNNANQIKKAIQEKVVDMKPIPLVVGDKIKYASSRGVLRGIKKDIALIECDGINLRVPLGTLKRSGNAPKLPKGRVKIEARATASGGVLLDLHGLRSEEAVEKLDKFISDALINGFDEVKVYHGIGTGKLAFAVREFLKSHPSVVSFGDASIYDGGFGATIVKL